MNQKKIFLGIIFLIIVAGLIKVTVDWSSTKKAEDPAPTSLKFYESTNLGISFYYPEYYFLEEKNLGNGERNHYAIILTEDTEENRLVREGKSPGREGPLSINIEAFQNNLDNVSLENWIQNTSESNYKLALGTFSETVISSKRALEYRWSGLYEGKSAVTEHKGNIIFTSVTFLTPNDTIISDYTNIIKSLELQ